MLCRDKNDIKKTLTETTGVNKKGTMAGINSRLDTAEKNNC